MRSLVPHSWSRRRLVLVTLAVALCVPSLRAHEIGTTRVSVVFTEEGTYRVEVVTDAATLVAKLEALTGSSAIGEASVPRLASGLARLDDAFRQRVTMAFDGSPVRPATAYAVAAGNDSAPAMATITLTGTVPPQARQFTWTYGWTFASYALSVRHTSHGAPVTAWLEGGQTSTPVPLVMSSPPVNRLGIAGQYLVLGFTHIVPKGLDHMLFVLGLYLLSRRAKWVLWQVSAFTVAHSITLGLSMYGVLAVSPRIVEPLIAISIAYVAVENLFVSELKSWRVALVFAFGLLHGLGFAGVLGELGLPRAAFVTALVSFNVGVEAGQLAVIAAAFVLVGWHWGARPWYRRRIVMPASAAIACTAVYWTIARLTS